MTETSDKEGLNDLSNERVEWWQKLSDDQQRRTGFQAESPYQHGAAPNRSNMPATALVVDDGVGDKMAAIQHATHGMATLTAVGRNLPQSCAATLVAAVGSSSVAQYPPPQGDDVTAASSDNELRLAAAEALSGLSQKRHYDSGGVIFHHDSFDSSTDVLNRADDDDVGSNDSTLVCSGAVGGVDQLVARETLSAVVHHRDVESEDDLFDGRW